MSSLVVASLNSSLVRLRVSIPYPIICIFTAERGLDRGRSLKAHFAVCGVVGDEDDVNTKIFANNRVGGTSYFLQLRIFVFSYVNSPPQL